MATKTYESLSQASERTQISIKTLRRRIADGDLPAYRSGPKILRLDTKDVDNLMRPIHAKPPRRRKRKS